MKLHIKDPGHVALRRGIRAAVGVPITCAFALWLLPRSPGGFVSAFGSLCLIALCDFGGPPRRRFLSLIGAGAVGTVLVALGVLAAATLPSAVVVMFIVGSVLALAPVLHGSVASAAGAMTVMYVVATTAGIPAEKILEPVAGWLLAVVISIPVTLFTLPRRNLAPVRQACSNALLVFADSFDARACGEQPDIEALTAAQDTLRHSYLGNPFRAAGLSGRDRSLMALAGQVQGLLSSMCDGRAYPTPMVGDALTRALNQQSAQALRAAGMALLDAKAAAPSGLAIVADWRRHWDGAVALMTETAAGEALQRVCEINAQFPDRAMAVAAVRVVMVTRRVIGLPDEQYPAGPDIPAIPAPVPSPRSADIRAHLTLRSPWARLALRTGLGLAIAVAVVQLTGLAHGLWVVLGVTAVLRFDGLTTLRTAGFAALGTLGGAAVGYAILAADTSDIAFLWVAIVVVTFLAVWVPAAVGFALGQAAFSLFVILAFTLMTWPPDISTAAERFEDVLVGAAVSVVVALLLWPHGILRGMVANVADAVRDTAALMRDAMTSLVSGGTVDSDRFSASARSFVRAQEVVELSLGSPTAGAAQYAYGWQAVIDNLRTPMVVGRLMSGWAAVRPTIATVVPSLTAALDVDRDAAVLEWDSVAAEIDGAPTRLLPEHADVLAGIAAAADRSDLSVPEVADCFVTAVWGHGWLRMARQAGEVCEVPSPPGSEPARRS